MARKDAKSETYAVGFLGGGNMATALTRGLIAADLYEAAAICASDVDATKRRLLKRRLGVGTMADNDELVRRSRVIVLAVKPQVMDDVVAAVAPEIRKRHLVISIAAGVSTQRLEKRLGGEARVVRVMPNTPSLLGRGAAVVVGGRYARKSDVRLALRLMRAVGEAHAVSDERLIDAVTGLSGSGPAYVYRFAEALIRGGVKAGLSPELSRALVFQTVSGAAAMLQETGQTPEQLRAAVSSPGGTTLAGLAELDRRGFVDTVVAGVLAARRRSRELAAVGRGARVRGPKGPRARGS